MCTYKSAIVLHDEKCKGGFRVLLSPWTESHSELITIHQLKDKFHRLSFARVEFSPDKLENAHLVGKYKLRLDEERMPEWWSDDVREGVTEHLSSYVKSIIVNDERELLIGGQFILGPRARINTIKEAIVNVMLDGGTVKYITGGTVNDIRGGTVNDITGGTVKYITGGTVKYITGGTVKYITGGTVNDIRGGTVNHITGGTVNHITGGTVNDITGGTVNQHHGRHRQRHHGRHRQRHHGRHRQAGARHLELDTQKDSRRLHPQGLEKMSDTSPTIGQFSLLSPWATSS